MLTTGFKYYFGMFVTAALAAVLVGYSSGGDETGPLSLGYKGAVGNHLAYSVLVVAAGSFLLLALVSVAFRDAGAREAAELLGTDEVPVGQPPVFGTYWPLFGALAAGITAIGLVVHPAVFVLGIILLGAIAIEWTMSAWADRATGDPEANRELRHQLMRPFEVPVLAVAGVGVIVLATSRILLSVSATGAVYVAIVISGLVFVGAIVFSMKPQIPSSVLAGAVAVFAVGSIVAGIVSASIGEREFHEHGEGEAGEHSESEGEAGDHE